MSTTRLSVHSFCLLQTREHEDKITRSILSLSSEIGSETASETISENASETGSETMLENIPGCSAHSCDGNIKQIIDYFINLLLTKKVTDRSTKSTIKTLNNKHSLCTQNNCP